MSDKISRPFHDQAILDLLYRDTLALHILSDTISIWDDFDAALTSHYSHNMPRSTDHGIDANTTLGAFGINLIVELIDTIKENIRKQENEVESGERKDLSRSIKRIRKDLLFKAIRIVANQAPRIGTEKNGKDFYLAITDNEAEIYVTPLEMLKYTRERLTHLFRIPTKGHPLFDGEREQFRSRIIARSCEYPEHLIPQNFVLNKTEAGEGKIWIPDQAQELEIGYTDKFGNHRIRSNNPDKTFTEIHDKKSREDGTIAISINGKIYRAQVTNSLREVEDESLGIYQNVADGNGSPWWEIVVKGGSAHQTTGSPEIGSEVKIIT